MIIFVAWKPKPSGYVSQKQLQIYAKFVYFAICKVFFVVDEMFRYGIYLHANAFLTSITNDKT